MLLLLLLLIFGILTRRAGSYGYLGSPAPRGAPLGRVESNGGGFQKLIPRFTPSSRPISVNGVLIRRPGTA